MPVVTPLYESHALAALIVPREPRVAPQVTEILADRAVSMLTEVSSPYALVEAPGEDQPMSLIVTWHNIITPAKSGPTIADSARRKAFAAWAEILPELKNMAADLTDYQFSKHVGILMITSPTPQPPQPGRPGKAKRAA